MAHEHHHHGESSRDYFTEQLLTIFVVGLFGYVAISMYRNGMLSYILAPQFHTPVLIGGIAVVGLVILRALAVWREAGEMHAHEHEHHHHHDHGHDHAHGHHHHHDHEHKPGEVCDHDHAHDHGHHHHDHHHHDHAHDHGHEHSEDDHGHSHDLAWVFARMLVLIFPVSLFFLGVPNSGFSQERLDKLLGKDQSLGSTELADLANRGETKMGFNDLNDAAFDEAKRNSFQGQVTQLEGRFKKIGDKEFTLFRLKMTCCAADTVPLKVRIVAPQAVGGFSDFDWVRVKGQIQFVQVPGSDRYIPVIKVADITDIKKLTENEARRSEYE